MKFLGILFAAIAAFFLLWMGFGFIWWQNNHQEVMQKVDQAVVEGQEIGKDASDQECLSIYLDIMRDCKEMACSIQNQVFLKSCLSHANTRAGLCNGVPDTDDLIALARWAAQVCEDHQLPQSHCAGGLQEVAIYCQENPGF